MIIFDPTEIRSGTVVPAELIELGSVCQNLEAVTGADFLVSPLDGPNINDAETKLGSIFLRKHLDAGAVLVQRKSGGDIVNFITDHDQILAKMLQHTTHCWLLTIGNYYGNEFNKLCCNDAILNWSYWSYWGALHSWQMRGGYVDNITYNSDMLAWYNHVLKKLQDTETQHYVMPRKPSQMLLVEDSDDGEIYQRNACIAALATIDSVGIAKAAAIADYCGNLLHALVFLSDPRNNSLPNKPSGIGSKIFANASRWLGAKRGGEGENQWYEALTIEEIYPQKKE